ncbi:MAG: ExeA family protein, partial [Pyrinomonadaceae bacterium]
LREVLNYTHLRQLKQRVALRCEIGALPNVEETAHYISSRLKVAGAANTDVFSPGAIDYIFRCSAGIPRNINNLCDNALLNGFASGDRIISRAMVEEVATTFDMLPRKDRNVPNDEGGVRIFNAAGRAELWAAGNGNGDAGVSPVTHARDPRATRRGSNGNGHGNGNSLSERPAISTFDRNEPAENFSLISPAPEPGIIFNEHSPRNEPSASSFGVEELGSAFNRSGFGRGNNGQSL